MNRKPMIATMILIAAVAILHPTTRPAHAASSRACDAFARDYARNAGRNGQVVKRGLFGGLLGAGVGAVAGSTGTGAAVGTGVGVLSGAHARHRKEDRIYKAAYRDCMAGRVR